MATKKKAAKKAAKKKAAKIPRQRSLPGMGDKKIIALENRALDYAEKLEEIHDLMRKAGKTEYNRGGISVVLMEKEETVKLRVRDEDEIHAKDKPQAEPPEDEPDEEPVPDTGEEEEGEEEEVPEVHVSET